MKKEFNYFMSDEEKAMEVERLKKAPKHKAVYSTTKMYEAGLMNQLIATSGIHCIYCNVGRQRNFVKV